MCLEEFKKISLKNRKDFIKAKRRIKGRDNLFITRVHANHIIIDINSDLIIDALDDFFNHENISFLLGEEFEKALVYKILMDYNFIAFLIQSNLINRAINLTRSSNNSLKVRLYFAMLDYNKFITEKGDNNNE